VTVRVKVKRARVEKDRDTNCSKVYGLPRRSRARSRAFSSCPPFVLKIKTVGAKGRGEENGIKAGGFV